MSLETTSGMDTPLFYLLAFLVFVVFMIIIVWLRTSKLGKGFEFKTSDVVLALVPIVFLLLVTGRIQKFVLGDMELEFALAAASEQSIDTEVKAVKDMRPEYIEMQPAKTGTHLTTPDFIKNKSETVVIKMGVEGARPEIIARNLATTSEQEFVKYIVLEDAQGSFSGMFDAAELAKAMSDPSARYTWDKLGAMVASGNFSVISRIPGFVAADEAVAENASKRTTLEKMDIARSNVLPVVNKAGDFVGVVDKTQVNASLVTDVSRIIQQRR